MHIEPTICISVRVIQSLCVWLDREEEEFSLNLQVILLYFNSCKQICIKSTQLPFKYVTIWMDFLTMIWLSNTCTHYHWLCLHTRFVQQQQHQVLVDHRLANWMWYALISRWSLAYTQSKPKTSDFIHEESNFYFSLKTIPTSWVISRLIWIHAIIIEQQQQQQANTNTTGREFPFLFQFCSLNNQVIQEAVKWAFRTRNLLLKVQREILKQMDTANWWTFWAGCRLSDRQDRQDSS